MSIEILENKHCNSNYIFYNMVTNKLSVRI